MEKLVGKFFSSRDAVMRWCFCRWRWVVLVGAIFLLDVWNGGPSPSHDDCCCDCRLLVACSVFSQRGSAEIVARR